jgi:hypothetical protein
VADKAYWSQERRRWYERRKIGNGILRKVLRGQALDKTTVLLNTVMSRVRCGIETCSCPWPVPSFVGTQTSW